jgi:S-disulfanyl-L-cysteine oxidoreductase SoxD
MCIPPDGFAFWRHDIVKRLAPPRTPPSVVNPPRLRRIAGACLAGGLALAVPTSLARAQGYPSRYDFGTTATEQEIAAVAIAISTDGKRLPPGKGDYGTGKTVYEMACAACHGKDLQGVAGLPDMPSGAALRLIGGRGTLASTKPVVTVESYWPYATTLFDYIRRAMPFSAPGSLSNDEVYAVTAYILAEGNIIDKTTVIDAETLPKVQMPNRDGFIPDPRPELFK